MKNIDGWVVERMWSKLNNFDDKPAELNPISFRLVIHFLFFDFLSPLRFLGLDKFLGVITTLGLQLGVGLKNVQSSIFHFDIDLGSGRGVSCAYFLCFLSLHCNNCSLALVVA